jgi:hypothetical protein
MSLIGVVSESRRLVMRKFISSDKEGVESIPLKLIIVILILAIIIPSFFMGLATYSNAQAENDIRSEIERIISTIKQTNNGDEGTSFSLTVNFQEGIFKRLEYVKIGDKIGEHGGSYPSVVRYKFHGENIRYMIIENPNIMTTSSYNSAFELGTGRTEIIAEKHMIGQVGFIVIRKPDEEIQFKIADLMIDEDDVTISNRDDNIPGLMISVTIHNIGTLSTAHEDAKWSGDGKIRVSFYDRVVLTGEMRTIQENLTIDDIAAGGQNTTSIEWFPIQAGDNPQDPKLRTTSTSSHSKTIK